MGAVGDAYAGSRRRIAELVGTLAEADAAVRVPACPSWTVHDVVAHVAGVVDDVLAGRLEGVATEPWTAAQVEARRSTPISEMLARWNEQAPAFEAFLDDVGDPGRQAVADVATHEHDLRGALGRAGARDTDAVAIGLGFLAPSVVSAAAGSGIGLCIRVPGGESFGADGSLTLEGTRFELLRALTGRRSAEQIRSLEWDGDPSPALGLFTWGPFRPAEQAIVE